MTGQNIQCPCCNAKIFDGEVIKGVSVIKIAETHSEGKCKTCKTWVTLPLIYSVQGSLPGYSV